MKLFLLTLFILFGTFSKCGKDDVCEKPTNQICYETPPTDELCDAYFERWFYNIKSKSCKMVAYSGCSQKGFETQRDCQNCKKCKEEDVCNQKPPTDELCKALFTRWFYDSESGTCKEISYGGCNVWGFETQEACQKCK